MDRLQREFGQRLRVLRENRGISVRGLAKTVGVSSVTVWKWEKGDAAPRQRTLGILAEALGVTLSAFRNLENVEAKPRSPLSPVRDTSTVDVDHPPYASRPDNAVLRSSGISATIVRAKQMIAEASGTSPGKVTIRIEY